MLLRNFIPAFICALALGLGGCNSSTVTSAGGIESGTPENTAPEGDIQNAGGDSNASGTTPLEMMQSASGPISTKLSENPTFETFLAAATSSGVIDLLANPEELHTVFLPNDAAFDALGDDALTALMADPTALESLLRHHIIADQVIDIDQVELPTVLSPLSGGDLVLTNTGDTVAVNGADVSLGNIFATNGVIHVIDTVLIPEANITDNSRDMSIFNQLANDSNFSTLTGFLISAGLDTTLSNMDGSFTLFAPTNAAFDRLDPRTRNGLAVMPAFLQNLLQYHVIPDSEVNLEAAIASIGTPVTMANGESARFTLRGGELHINDARVSVANQQTGNGIIHTIDSVLFPPPTNEIAPTLTILDVLTQNGNFNILVQLLEASGLDAALADPEQNFTLFAPTDDAFTAQGPRVVNGLLLMPGLISNVLEQHLVEDQVLDQTDLFALVGTRLQMANGSRTTITEQSGLLLIDDAAIIQPNASASNGVIHTISIVIQ